MRERGSRGAKREARGAKRETSRVAFRNGVPMDDSSPPHAQSGDVTRLLGEFRNGDKEALDRLLPLVYDELRRLAKSYLKRERGNHTLQPTALVHEAYFRLVDQ